MCEQFIFIKQSVLFYRLLAAGALPSSVDVDGLTPTHYAAMAGTLDNMRLLPKEDLSAPDVKSKRLPIHYAGNVTK